MKLSIYDSYPRLRSLVCLRSITLAVFSAMLIPSALSAQNAPKSHRKAVVTVEPEYPAVLKNGHFDGAVRLDVTVLANGSVSKVDVKGGNPMLAQYAAQAVMKWKYVPAAAQTLEEVVFNFNSNAR